MLLPGSNSYRKALNSAVECHLHTVEVIGSNPIAPTIFSVVQRDSRSACAPFPRNASSGILRLAPYAISPSFHHSRVSSVNPASAVPFISRPVPIDESQDRCEYLKLCGLTCPTLAAFRYEAIITAAKC